MIFSHPFLSFLLIYLRFLCLFFSFCLFGQETNKREVFDQKGTLYGTFYLIEYPVSLCNTTDYISIIGCEWYFTLILKLGFGCKIFGKLLSVYPCQRAALGAIWSVHIMGVALAWGRISLSQPATASPPRHLDLRAKKSGPNLTGTIKLIWDTETVCDP